VQFLAGKTSVITGGASGIGLATAERVLAAGMRVANGDQDTEDLAEAESRIGNGVLAVRCDVTAPDSMLELQPGPSYTKESGSCFEGRRS